jgi:hypothetical protein
MDAVSIASASVLMGTAAFPLLRSASKAMGVPIVLTGVPVGRMNTFSGYRAIASDQDLA